MKFPFKPKDQNPNERPNDKPDDKPVEKPEPTHSEAPHMTELDGSPGAYDVSVVAMGGHPGGAQQEQEQDNKLAQLRAFYGDDGTAEDCGPEDLSRAYSQLFESLAIITRK